MIHALFTLLDLAGLVLLGVYLAQMLLAALLPVRPSRSSPDPALRYTFVIPALNEELVIADTVHSLRAAEPGARVVVIDDASTDRTREIVQALADGDPAVQVLCRTLPRAQQGKGQALNWAAHQLLDDLQAAGADLSREVFVIVDADGRVTPRLLPEASAALSDERVMGAQARVRIRPSGGPMQPGQSRPGQLVGRLLERQQDLEFFIMRHVQRLRERWHTVCLFGNGQFMRASYLQSQRGAGQGAWPDCLLEDFASGLQLRLSAPAHRTAFLDAAVTQQGLPDLRRFVRQRARWTQGTLQCLGYLRRLWTTPMPWAARLDLSYFILGPWINVVILLSLLTQPLRWLLGAHGLVLGTAVNVEITVLNTGLQLLWLLRYRREQRLGWGPLLFTVASLPVYGLALLLSLPLAYWNHFSGRRTWDKSSRHAEASEPLHAVNGD